MNRLKKILIANRGEIALRIIRTAKKLGIRTVAIFSKGEENALHVTKADEAISLGEGSLNETYLNIEKIIAAAKNTGAEAIHPGYGFLSENHLLAEACQKNEILFIGPSPEVLRLMGNKLEAKALAEKSGIPVLKNYIINDSNIKETASALSYPVLIKSAHGGGGKGMQIVWTAAELGEKVTKATRMAQNYFGNGEVYLEPYIELARHIEVQVLGDNYGNLVHLYERDCTLQRNYQKIIEEAPAPALNEDTRNAILNAALTLCKSVSYSGAGTVEFLVSNNGNFYFMEMNPRIQVEHPVTEEITGIDIVAEQLSIAAGNPLSFTQSDVKINGHAIEVRIYSEDPLNGFAPSTAPVTFFRFPRRPDIRIETDLAEESFSAGSQFDPLLCKIIVKGSCREEALVLMNEALQMTTVSGPATNQQYLRALLQMPEVLQATTDTRFCENRMNELLQITEKEKTEAPYKELTAAFLFLKFLPNDPQSSNPWIRLGFRNILNQADVHINGLRFNIPLTALSHKYLTVKDKIMKYELSKGAFPFRIKWQNEDITVVARRVSPYSLKITTTKRSVEIIFSENQSGETVLHWHGFEFMTGSHDLLDYYPTAGRYTEPEEQGGENRIISHLHGKVIDIKVTTNQLISKGDLLMIIEAMKSENHIQAHKTAKVKTIEVAVGSQVTDRMPLITLEEI
jgi:acetyl/propionyl-CoA carboxylase alpha subunit